LTDTVEKDRANARTGLFRPLVAYLLNCHD
jgi:hypothetical protein